MGATTSMVQDLDWERRKAMVDADMDTLDRLLDDDLVWIHATGRVEGKASLLAPSAQAPFATPRSRCLSRLSATSTASF